MKVIKNNHIKDVLERKLLIEIPSRLYRNILIINGDCKLEFKNTFIGKIIRKNVLNKKVLNQIVVKDKTLGIEGDIVHSLINQDFIESNLSNKYKFDLIIISSILYQKYIAQSLNLIYYFVENILEKRGILATVHEQNLYKARFPYLLLNSHYFDYEIKRYIMEIYIK